MIRLIALLVAHQAFGLPCDRMNVTDPKDRIVNGVPAVQGEFPFMVSMQTVCGLHICGGTILTKNWVLSAAHCFTMPSITYVRSGSIYLHNGGTSHQIVKIINHEGFNPNATPKNDISLIRVVEPFTFDNNTQQVTLPIKGFPVKPGENLTNIGWGYTDPTVDYPSRVLMKADEAIVMDNEECGKRVTYPMYPSYLCTKTGPKHQSAWLGDSGGPTIKNNVQVGIISFLDVLQLDSLHFYTRVSHFIDWIREKLGPDAADLKFIQG